MQVTRVGPPTATLQRRLEVGGRSGSLALLVEVWGLAEPRQHQAIERRLAEGMANIFERREGGVTARLRLALQAGDRWLRRVQDAAGPDEDLSGLGAGASLLWCAEGEATLAQAGPALAFARLATPDAAELPAAELPDAIRHPDASPWLRRGIERLTADPLWPPLGLGDAARLEIHWASWPFPPGAAALLAPSRAAEALRREAVAAILGEAPELAARRFDELLPAGLPALLIHHPRPPDAMPPPLPEDDLDLTTRYDAVAWGTAAQDLSGLADADRVADGADRAAAADSGDAAIGEQLPLPGVSSALPSTPPAAPATAPPPRPEAWSARAELSALAGLLLPALRRLGVRTARATARVLVATVPRRERVGADSYAVETARLTAAAVLVLPLLALLLTWMMVLRGAAPGSGGLGSADDAAAGTGAQPTALAPDPAAADPPELGIRRLVGLQPAADLVGEPGDGRRLVVSGDAAWVLNTALDRVDRVALAPAEGGTGLADATPREALAKRRTVGEDVVGALDDLFWLPPPLEGPDAGERGRVLALDAAGRLWAMDETGVSALPRPAQPEWTTVSLGAGFDGRLYALDRSVGQIFRYTATGGAWPAFSVAGEPWLAAATDLAAARDLTIDGSVYVLMAGGGLLAFEAGQARPVGVSGVPGGLVEPVALQALPSAGLLLLADRGGRRIVALGKDGAFRAQLLKAPQPAADDDGGLADLHDLWWDERGALLYVLAGKTLWIGPFAGLGG